MDAIIFLKALGITILFLLLIGGFLYWIIVLLRKIAPDFRWWVKYKLFKKKYDEGAVRVLMDDFDKGIKEDDIFKEVLKESGNIALAKELCYIYREIIKSKGGVKNG